MHNKRYKVFRKHITTHQFGLYYVLLLLRSNQYNDTFLTISNHKKQLDPNVKHMDIVLGPLYLWTHPGVQP